MSVKDTCVTLVPYFEVDQGQLAAFKKLCDKFIDLTSTEEKCVHYGFSFCNHEAHCREGYTDADGVLKHLENVDAPLKAALEIAKLIRLEVHGPAEELDKLREPLAALDPKYYVLEYGFRNE